MVIKKKGDWIDFRPFLFDFFVKKDYNRSVESFVSQKNVTKQSKLGYNTVNYNIKNAHFQLKIAKNKRFLDIGRGDAKL